MADDIPIDGGQAPVQQPGMMQRINNGMNNFFGPINRGLEGIMGKPDPRATLLQSLGAIRPGIARMPMPMRTSFMGPPQREYMFNPVTRQTVMPVNAYPANNVASAVRNMPDFPQSAIPNQPGGMPRGSDLILQMLRQRANPQGVLQQTRTEQATNPYRFRPQTFEPTAERLMQPLDAMRNTRVMTPANMSQDQAYNWALMRQLRGE